MTVGVIADTHGILLPEALLALQGSELIVHAGDVGPPSLLEELETIAPVSAVYGNTDGEALRAICPAERLVAAGAIRIGVIHGDRWPAHGRSEAMARHFSTSRVQVVVYGHTHRPLIETIRGVTLFNPGAAGKRTFGRKLSVGRLVIQGQDVKATVIPIE